MSYKTFEIKNNTVIIKDAIYKGIAATKACNLKELPEDLPTVDKTIDLIDSDMDIYLDSDNWGDSLEDWEVLADMQEY